MTNLTLFKAAKATKVSSMSMGKAVGVSYYRDADLGLSMVTLEASKAPRSVPERVASHVYNT